MCRERYSYGTPIPPLLTLPNNGGWLLLLAQASSHALSAMALCFSAHDALFHSPSGCLHTASSSPLPGTELRNLNLVPSSHPSNSGCSVLGSATNGLCGTLSALPSSVQLLCFYPRLCHFTSNPADLPICQVASQGEDSFSLSQLPLRSTVQVLIPFFSSSFSFFPPFVLPSYAESFLPFLEV